MNLFSKLQILLISVFNSSDYIFGVPLMLQYSKLVIRIIIIACYSVLFQICQKISGIYYSFTVVVGDSGIQEGKDIFVCILKIVNCVAYDSL